MNALSIVFPTAVNQVCRWHIEQNILKNCRKYFNNVADFDASWAQLRPLSVRWIESPRQSRWKN
ncbi:hypothetical protein LIPSTDRAFT_155377 [Lipomyces starkeyi NRRL Y-11557]|uniref:MULE transposase domain-containing protein n=1 Tax=Lipomyces starkeyi NRRL Y-11557 TaxID=675824 RepID=A0A1E3PZF7_LIPST|nr:hypothetical protein LIPSTDRAFT_155377 [Lipomyces starkeyi NRRL Y-11557]